MEELLSRIWSALTDVPQTREKLCGDLGIKDRDLRKAIKTLRDYGYNIASNSNTSGYWRGTEADKRRTVAEYRSRGYKDLATADAIERGPIDGQMNSFSDNVEDWR